MSNNKKEVCIVITTLGLEWTKKCIKDLLENTIYDFKLVLVDDNSSVESSEEYENVANYFDNLIHDFYRRDNKLESSCRFLQTYKNDKDKRKGVAASWNIGIRLSKYLSHLAFKSNPDYVLVLNNDVLFPPKLEDTCWLTELVRFADEHPEYSWISPAWLWRGHDKDSVEQFKNYSWKYMKQQKDSTEEGGLGCFYLLRCKDIEKLKEIEKDTDEPHPGYFDETSYPAQWEEVDFIARLNINGFKSIVTHSVALYHYGSAFIGSEEWQPIGKKEYDQGFVAFRNKWRKKGFDIPYNVLPRVINGIVSNKRIGNGRVSNGRFIYMYEGKERIVG